MAGKTKVAARTILAGMRMVRHKICDRAQVGVENHRAVQLHFDGGTLDCDLLKIPFADGTLKAVRIGGRTVIPAQSLESLLTGEA